jgi:hypothetical protein
MDYSLEYKAWNYINLIEETIQKMLHDIGTSKNFFKQHPQNTRNQSKYTQGRVGKRQG